MWLPRGVHEVRLKELREWQTLTVGGRLFHRKAPERERFLLFSISNISYKSYLQPVAIHHVLLLLSRSDDRTTACAVWKYLRKIRRTKVTHSTLKRSFPGHLLFRFSSISDILHVTVAMGYRKCLDDRSARGLGWHSVWFVSYLVGGVHGQCQTLALVHLLIHGKAQ